MAAMKKRIDKKAVHSPRIAEAAEKECKIKELIAQLEQHGITIRREKLKSGHGWKTVSGSCRMSEKSLVFVDRKLPLDEQLLFLSGIVSQLKEGDSAVAA